MRKERIIIASIKIGKEGTEDDILTEYKAFKYVVEYIAIYLNLEIRGTITKKQIPKQPSHMREMIVADILRQINA